MADADWFVQLQR